MAEGRAGRFGVAKREAYLEALRDGQRRVAAARFVGVAPSTVTRFAKEHPEFARAIDEAEMEANEVVEDALYQAAASGNVIACQVWLYNREPDRWMDMRRIGINQQVSGEVDHRVSIDPTNLDAEIERSLARLMGETTTNERLRTGDPLGEDPRLPALSDARQVVDAVIVEDEHAST